MNGSEFQTEPLSSGFAFMYGEESERGAILKNADEIIEPNSSWLISPDFQPRKVNGRIEEISKERDTVGLAEVQAACPTMAVTLDGVFLDTAHIFSAVTAAVQKSIGCSKLSPICPRSC